MTSNDNAAIYRRHLQHLFRVHVYTLFGALYNLMFTCNCFYVMSHDRTVLAVKCMVHTVRIIACSHRRHGQDKTVLSRPCQRCEQAITRQRRLSAGLEMLAWFYGSFALQTSHTQYVRH